MGLGRVKTKSDLVVMPSGRQIFVFFCSQRDRIAQNSGCGCTAERRPPAIVSLTSPIAERITSMRGLASIRPAIDTFPLSDEIQNRVGGPFS
jgi:hypothetical protein